MHCYEVIRPDGGEEKARHDGVLGRWADRQQSAIFYISNEDDKMSATTPHICGWSY